jgi:site-specific DNA-methyltransferase (adenine-specific)
LTPILKTPRGASYCAEALAALRFLRDDGQRFSLAWIDGPYFVGKAAWDPRISLDEAVAWYQPYLEAMTAVCAPSASVYLWNTDALEAELRRPMRALGWTFRGRITWEKPNGHANKMAVDDGEIRTWPDTTEACGFYQREEWAPATGAGTEIAYAAGADDRNVARLFLTAEWADAKLRNREVDTALGTNGMSGHFFGTSQWALPTWEAYRKIAEYAQDHGAPRDRPYLVLPEVWGGSADPLRASYDHLRASYDHLRESYDHLRESYDHLRAEYEASRPAFTSQQGITCVWRHMAVAGAERLRTPSGESHPCQKPLVFADRAVVASTRPGEAVLDLFAGTHRIAVAVERMKDARTWVAIEQDPRWADIVRPHLRWDAASLTTGAQPSLFGGGDGR